MTLRFRAALTFGLTAILLLAELLTLLGNGASAQVDGNSYTGPIYGHTLIWNDAWQVLDEKSEQGGDELVLGDGTSVVGFYAHDAFLGNATACARSLALLLSKSTDVSNAAPMIGPDGQEVRGGDSTRAFVAYTYRLTFDDGTYVDLGHRRECRTLVPGSSVLTIDHQVPLFAYDFEVPVVEELLAGLMIPSPGETGPAFITGRLRMSVAGAMEQDAIPDVKLTARPGKDWMLLLVDATNTSSTPATMTPNNFGLTTTGAKKPAKLAPGSTLSVAKRLHIDQGNVEDTTQIGPGETRRLVLVFQIPAGSDQPALRIGSAVLPLQIALGRRLDFQSLPASYGPPRMIEATVDHVINGGALSVIPAGQSAPIAVRLIGIDSPVGAECYAEKAQTRLGVLAGQTVLLESDRTNRQAGGLARYVWTRKDDGSLSMVNRTLLAGGYAGYDVSPNNRFSAWLQQGADAARIKPAGLWKSCTGLHGTALAQTDANASESPSAPPQTKPAPLNQPQVRDGNYQGTSTEGWPFSLTVKDGGIVEFTYEYACGNSNGRGSGTFKTPIPITDGAFKIDQHAGPLSVVVAGTFRGDNSASGTLEVDQNPGPCAGPISTTWNVNLAS